MEGTQIEVKIAASGAPNDVERDPDVKATQANLEQLEKELAAIEERCVLLDAFIEEEKRKAKRRTSDRKNPRVNDTISDEVEVARIKEKAAKCRIVLRSRSLDKRESTQPISVLKAEKDLLDSKRHTSTVLSSLDAVKKVLQDASCGVSTATSQTIDAANNAVAKMAETATTTSREAVNKLARATKETITETQEDAERSFSSLIDTTDDYLHQIGILDDSPDFNECDVYSESDSEIEFDSGTEFDCRDENETYGEEVSLQVYESVTEKDSESIPLQIVWENKPRPRRNESECERKIREKVARKKVKGNANMPWRRKSSTNASECPTMSTFDKTVSCSTLDKTVSCSTFDKSRKKKRGKVSIKNLVRKGR